MDEHFQSTVQSVSMQFGVVVPKPKCLTFYSAVSHFTCFPLFFVIHFVLSILVSLRIGYGFVLRLAGHQSAVCLIYEIGISQVFIIMKFDNIFWNYVFP